ncbi:undecaprenyldiphospho-muramoylpentapeptide beta-N-acetylglucosaminyltransferase [bacterium (Candidatus Blackallbacteria) CG17_big_fil_post_rev_8_21_14_2_50_48_46]|uniref:UDP-N-acetylglucosamine--N-acetylmuramyl-(pentapeptide) pyrophosphoryl-undecaprenol N-acetylglucosamine transferase n=1 Tax=bacterium (Candidatus Blackallbacteria) CG17_big_fil_post_rev_8_21_14_2_50_48_46 TaxID=2014261 RepID=A0A2M7FXA5_9BACT|nr:MAG: undecaprenyldiphospho-muramoylpentapeptide beta-N-acetylglucosaminyltransferase [bacterium (Candidatus Blackallbacteria) CG18_big_fil_WC_8_21_14_2_50_49_26]PIW13712.1 MAG: undecaprenyldiphospho-muramoylpentapeptide beta-N-acetylglucosaminyltransferase [bacterium (Candidatus Blackallbacteria) CG17_big_fil_post_rev_8_21_14_2_50_48_46]PIW44938.1 MAG: undecaprenyldiphospho-muramoylpentapeptide beta-N-acetylglucosaminyltransferase [bacterium (Candidatus Blackallbacteria) CG13_big_fil_rev_8_21_
MKPEILITCGGTGGHIYPGLAVGRMLQAQGCEIRFMGSDSRMEKDKIPAEGFAFVGLPVQQLRKNQPVRSLKMLWNCIRMARQNLRKQRPVAVLGLGSYITVPAIVAAWQEKIPVILLETNVVPGKANQYLARIAKAVALAHAETEKYLPAGPLSRVTGSPIRPEILEGSREAGFKRFQLDAHCKTVSLIGGSQGAQRLNLALLRALPELLALENLQIVHVCGASNEAAVREAAGEYAIHPRYRLLNYVDDMPDLLACTDLVISRAGASSIAELLACQIPSILIPGSFGGGHQLDNAQVLDQAGAAILFSEAQLEQGALGTVIRDVITDTERLGKMRENCSRLNSPLAAEKVAQLVLEMISTPKEEAFAC